MTPATTIDKATRQRVTVIIPAHDEAQAIRPTLTHLLQQDFEGQLRIVVVPNGCKDDTAEIARSFRPGFRAQGRELLIVELPEGSKPKAINAGDALALPDSVRVYLDADIRLSPNAIRAVSARLQPGTGTHLCAPRIEVAAPRSLMTRAYVKVWHNVPYIHEDVICGLYAVSAEGRRRWDEYPIIIADDKFTRMHFERHERAVATEASMTIQMPEGLRELIKCRTRWTRGNIELGNVYPDLGRRDEGRYRRTIPHMLSHPTLWPSIPVFALVYIWGGLLAFRSRRANLSTWERSDTARAALAT